MSKERPILFSTEMVQAIQAGRKTQTRRLLRHIRAYSIKTGIPANNPPCKPGDILWVRETWQHVYNFDDGDQPIEGTGRYVYYADNPMPFDYWVDADTGEHKEQMPWKPSIHMPKAAARLFLRVKDVRIERLQEISEEQAEQEGCAGWHIEISGGPWGVEDDPDEGTAVDDFQRVWDGTIKPADLDKYGWNANPWVWVITFERCDKPEGWC